MSTLPVINQKWFRTKLISSGKEIKFRPFTGGEQKQLMIIKETNKDNDNALYKAMIDLTQNCVENIKIKDLYIVDFEKLFYNIRAVSDDNEINFKMKCKHCEQEIDLSVDTMEDFSVSNNNFKKKLKIDDETSKIVANFRQPTIDNILRLSNTTYETESEKTFDTMVYCLESVIHNENTITDFTHDDAMTFIESLPQNYFEDIAEFFNDMPTLICKKDFICDKCQKTFNLAKEEVKSFLA